MDDRLQQTSAETLPQPAEQRPHFTAPPWSGFGCAGVGCLAFAVFVVVQTIASFYVLERLHPDAIRIIQASALARGHLSQSLLQRWQTDILFEPYLFMYELLGGGALILCAIGLARAFLGARPAALGLQRGPTLRYVSMGLLWGVVLVVVSQIVSLIQIKLVGQHTQATVEALKVHHGWQSFILDFIAICAIAPFSEELLFRGVVFAGLVQRLPVILAAAISGLIFAAAHGEPWSVVPLAVVGTGLALVYYRTGSLWPNVFAHATFNSVSLIIVYLLPQFAT